MFDLELDKIVEEIKRRNIKQLLIQLPDGLKPKAKEIADYIEQKTDSEVFIWMSEAFGACDIPLGLELLNINLVVQFGHNRFHKMEW